MTIDFNVIYKILLINKVKLYEEFIDNNAKIKVSLIDKIITNCKYNNKYCDDKDEKVLGRIIEFLARYHDEQSGKRPILYNVQAS